MLTLEKYIQKQKDSGYIFKEKVILTNNRELGSITGWEPSENPEYITIEFLPIYSELVKSITVKANIIVRIEEKMTEKQPEYWIWISHHLLTKELSQELVKKILMGVGK